MKEFHTPLELMRLTDEIQIIAERISTSGRSKITKSDILHALLLEHPGLKYADCFLDVWDLTISLADLESFAESFDYSRIGTRVHIDVELPKSLTTQYKVRVKLKNDIWIIHRFDADPFPSNPHAHKLESAIKLHLGSGDLHRGRTLAQRLNRKDFLELQNRSEAAGVHLPPLEIW